MSARLRIGCSSWTSEAWWGRIYPRELASDQRLSAYARLFDTVEVDSSYYRDPGAFLVRRWARSTPEDFVFTMKVPRDLLDPKLPVDREAIGAFEEHARELGPKLGALLLQFPPWATPARAGRFLSELLPALDPGLRHAVELRDAGWFQGTTKAALLRELGDRRIALAWSYLTYVDVPPELTTDFVYLRFIGDHTTVPEESHGDLRVDRRRETRLWASRVEGVRDTVTNVFAFFNNHFAGFAPASANLFREALGLEPVGYELPTEGSPQCPAHPSTQTRLDRP
jgi:uncharacterized protein YecE (DUF72 family)